MHNIYCEHFLHSVSYHAHERGKLRVKHLTTVCMARVRSTLITVTVLRPAVAPNHPIVGGKATGAFF